MTQREFAEVVAAAMVWTGVALTVAAGLVQFLFRK